jgi:hypothetical protein
MGFFIKATFKRRSVHKKVLMLQKKSPARGRAGLLIKPIKNQL